ncbi:myb/SANT-like DNA-binding domain-containing protein 7 [Eublepharis macularius]|uniref:Myb/SANT-like DNA-binding domain-containing protein 7 n=1 Tax=Eublepharis macularius TaxID=481883 RepID=A0AA97JAY8_EUBMA|nr:myb/SANT-like DNA-binding domain-containing protein 7 [Eublepharis macularius]
MTELRPQVSRGVAWREREILDLLSFWGEEKIQDALKKSHRNIDYFERIAVQMASQGHKRSATECRSKTKTMRLEYKKVVAHNGISGNAPITCPYYRELNSILRGDASVKPRRVARSLCVESVAQHVLPTVPCYDGSEELFSHDLITIDREQVRSSTPSPRDGGVGLAQAAPENDLDVTVDGLADCEAEEPCPDAQEEPQSDGDSSSLQQGGGKDSTSTSMAEASPGSRLERIKSRRRRNAGLFAVADKMISQSGEEHKAQIAEWRIDREESVRWHDEEKKIQNDFIEATRQESIYFRRAWDDNLQVMQSAVLTLQTLGEILVNQQRAKSPKAKALQDTATENIAPRLGVAKRACVGRARARLTL